MSDEEEDAFCFAEDERVQFIGNKLCLILKLKPERWEKYVSVEDNQKVLTGFFEKDVNKMLVFSVTSAGVLTASEEVPPDFKNRGMYILKKQPTVIPTENYKKYLLFGILTPALLEQLSNTLEQVFVPVLSNTRNHRTWPQLISQDVSWHTENLQNKVLVVRGRFFGKTVLPIPAVTSRIEGNPQTSVNMQDSYDRTMVHAIETMVISWTHQIREVLKEDSARLLLKGLDPGPSAELDFWKSRKENMQSIYEQLQSPVVQKMRKILEMTESSYYPTFKTTIQDVFDALQEAQDVELHLRPLGRLLSRLQEEEFPGLQPLVAPLFHLICLVWTHCNSYRAPARIVVLLQELCNLFIQQATVFLCPEKLLKTETEEALEHVQVAVVLFRCVKETFWMYREKLPSYVNSGEGYLPWDFPSSMVFARFDHFLTRLLQLEDLLTIMLEFHRLEKLEFGGIKGKVYSEQVSSMYEEFMELCKMFKCSEYNPLDYNSQEFECEYECFKEKVLDFDRRLATILYLAFRDCASLESAFKLLAVCGHFLERPVIKEIFSPNFLILLQLFDQELGRCKHLYDSHIQQVEGSVGVLSKNMPLVSGSLKWARMLKERIQTPWANLSFVEDATLEGTQMEFVYQKYMEMLTLLDQYEEKVYSNWCNGLDQVCQFNLNQALIKRHGSTGLLSVNFNPELIAVLRDVKHMQMLDLMNIPGAALAVFEKKDIFVMYVGSLQLLVQLYNKLKQSVLEVEFPLIKAELAAVDGQLHMAEVELTWQDQRCWDYISSMKETVQDLERRVQKTKDNVEAIQNLMKRWSDQALFCRKDNKKDTQLMLDDRVDRLAKRYSAIQRDGQLIHKLIEENLSLFRADPAADAWRAYLEYVDEMVVDGLFSAIARSLEFFVENTEGEYRQAPLFEAQMVLTAHVINFRPSLDRDVGDGFYDLVEGLLGDVFRMSAQVKRVAAHLGMENYQHDMEDMLDLADLRQEVMERVDDVIKKALQYRGVYDCYSQLWLDDRAEFMRQFLLYGHALTAEEIDSFGEETFPETPPTIEQFKEQIDIYEAMYTHVTKIEDSKVFENWFRVDIKSFKMSLLNIIKKWSWMFKEHLITYVTDSLYELEEFIRATGEGLTRPVMKGDHSGLVEVMGLLLAVRDRQLTTDRLFEPLKATITLLEGYGQRMPEHVYTQLEELPEKWNGTKKLAVSVKHEVAPLQTAEVTVIRRKCVAFEIKQNKFRERFRMEAPFNYSAVKPYSLLQKAHREIRTLEEEMTQLQESSHLFEVSVPEYRQLKFCRREIVILKQVWDIVVYVHCSIEEWTKTPWREINVDQMDAELKRFAKDMRTLDKEARGWDVYSGLDLTVKNLVTSLRAVTELQNRAIRDRHWAQLISTAGVEFTMTHSTTLANLLALQLHRVEEEVHNIVDKAVKEMAIEKVLNEISQTWTTMEFSYEEHYRTSTPLLKSDEDLIETLEENQVQLQAILQSKHVEYFRCQVSEWQRRLTVADTVLLVWLEVQRTWAHLESIFIGSEDIRRQLPDHTHRFLCIDADFKDLMFGSAKTKNVIEATNKPKLFERLEDLQNRLALCEKALAEYLETKRLAFPRFYFVSSADLLDILSKGSQPREVTRHLAKLFDNITDLEFVAVEGMESNAAVGMYSKEREYVPFQTHCNCTGPVEAWLSCLEDAMRETVRSHVAEAVAVYEDRPREQWVLENPAQVALTGSQIWWTTDLQIVFERLEEGFESALKDYHRKQIAQLNSLINMLLGELLPGDRQKIMTVCTIDVHARDVVSKLIAQKVNNAQAFTWLSQLRHRWDEARRHCFINICDAQFLYSYEYLGNTPRLVITPLTDRCYITLTQSLHLTMSGAPAGPAGTGKTETTKDLGRALGVMVYVFNCSEQMDYKSIGNIYKGLAQTGAWGCFDEFNRISVEVLSVVAVQVKTIQDAIRNKKKRFLFLEEDITLKSSVGIFITMNPGYAGRTELPENLKALFRPCAMVVPDIQLICEIMLVAEGFLEARVLARKFITLYTLCRELLSKQDHYDWGLRAVKSVLVVAGTLKRGDKTRPEDQVLMRALRDFNLPKIVTDDVPIFMGLIGDLFPALEVQRRRDPEFEQAVRQTTLELHLQPEETFVLKVVQLEELLAVRHSVFVVGSAGTGKSQILRTLNKTYCKLKRKPVWSDLNPKAVSTDELFGFIHSVTREWKDGLLSLLMREQANISHPGPKWIVLDGDIDPMWIESLNTVMDDNKVLTLASNERIPLTPSMRLVFEISHLRTATPATVSRAGILYVNPQDLGWNPYVASWIDTRPHQPERANLTILFDKYIPPCLEQLRSSFKTITPIPEISMVQTLCSLLDCLLTSENIPPDSPRDAYETYFAFACIWAFGGALHQDQLHDYRIEFSQWWTKAMKTVKFPAQGSVFDYCLDPLTRRFLPWGDRVPLFEMEANTSLQAVLVHTSETVRLRYFMDLLLDRGQPLMLVGNAGVGKTALVGDKLLDLPENYMMARVPFNYYTTSTMLQKVLEKSLEKKAGRNYGPPGNRKLIYFIDDMNMPAVDSYGTVQPHTLIRQHLDYRHWYDRQKLSLKEIHNCQYVACMNPTAGSFTVNPRLQRHFSVFAVNFPSSEALDSIYSKILAFHLQQQPFSPGVLRMADAVVSASIWLHHRMVHNFLPTAVKFHYIFNLRDLSNIFQGLLFSTVECLRQDTDLVQLWLHETSRVYSDKLVEPRDHRLFHKLQMDAARKHFEGVEDHILFQQPLIYCHFSRGGEESRYMPVTKWDALRTILEEALESYNELNAAMNLVLFEDAMQHVCRISRILEASRGYGLLVGVGGSGKQSLTRLAAHLSSLHVFQITLRKGYGIQDLKVDLAGLYMKTGVKNLPTVLLLTDAQIPDERFLVLINDLLASGEIPDLFAEEEVDSIVAVVQAEMRGLGLLHSREHCWRFFIDRVRQQLKVVLCLSPVGSALRVRARHFPALVNCTAIDWFHQWPPEALQSVSRRFIQEIEGIEPRVQESISLFMAHVHTSVNRASEKYRRNERRHNYTTPKSFLQQITLYGNLLGRRRTELGRKMERVLSGLQKLQTTASQVEELKVKLSSQEVELNLKNRDTEALLTKIGLQTEKVSQKRRIADTEEQKVAAIQAEVSVKQRDCETDLAKAEPALEAATSALDTLNKVNLTELKTFPNPPLAVSNVAAAVMVLLAPNGRVPKDRGWRAARAFMGKVDDFLQTLVTYNKEHIPETSMNVLREQYLSKPEFHPDFVRTKSFAAAGLCAWIINIVRYYEVYCDVAPKRQALSQANTDLETATAKLLTIRKKVHDLDVNLRGLTAQFEKAATEKVRCQEEVTRTNRTIQLANRLVKGLEAENERWTQAVQQFEAQQKTLCGDVLLTAAFISYVGFFSQRYRQELLQDTWIPFLQSQEVPVPLTEGLDPVLMLTDDATLAAWHNEGLPSNRMSTENATILANCERWPLLIDPQQQGIKWIRNRFGPDLKVVQLGHKGYLDTIEQALATGETVLIENLGETMDPVLDPLLGRNTIKRGRYIQIGDKECEYHSGFQLLLHTKLANPHFPPELQAQTTLINFSVTRGGLEEQLLGEVVTRERPDLEALKSELTTQQNHFKIELKILEDELLTRLSAAEGSFLGDTALVEKLEHTKHTAASIHSKVDEAKENETKINEARELYRPAAQRASLLYFIICDLRNINPMYQFSLKAFNTMFHKAIERADRAEEVTERVLHLTEAVTYSVFLHTSQGLFERDRLTFLSQAAFQILLMRGSIDAQELDFLLRFPVEPSRGSPVSFLSPQAWGAIKTISTLEEFRGLDRDMEGSAKRWRKLVESEQDDVRAQELCGGEPGAQVRGGARIPLEKSFEESGPATPIFFILSPGVNPLKDVESLGRKLGFTIDLGKLHNLSLGQGQEGVAERVLERASQEGHWVILQNVHLVARWLGALEKLLERTAGDSHPDYRVFISAEPARSPEEHLIPQGILESAIKITNEPPTGMHANLHAALGNFNQDTLEMCSRELEFKGLLFSLCYFHACVAERRKFGPQGWNRSYPFNTGDLTISVNVLYNYLEANTKVPWEDLCYLIGEIMYGGHITDDWDRRLCCTYLHEFMQPSMFEGELFLCPGFLAPPNLDYSGYRSYVDMHLPPENPTLYGLHPNAEIEFLTVTSDALFRTLLELQLQDTFTGEGAVQSTEEKVKSVLDDILEKLPEEFNLAEIMAKTSERSPYILVCFQECERMNVLIEEMRRSLKELDLGLKGELTISAKMEALQAALFYDGVPELWTRLAYPSTNTLAQWFSDLLARCRELDTWTQDLVLPAVVWLSGLFNPQSFLTAIMQSIARKNEWALDKMCLTVDVTKKTKEDYGHAPREGAYIHGLHMEGARWDTQTGMITDALLKELTPPMPVVFLRAMPSDRQELKSIYECPVYKTKVRGPTYVWTFPLKTRDPPAKWVLAGVALLLSV
ncbi:hypothetical protein ANANG_G00010770 [Anguilla anguilla]|uniref:Uncharacterized protein n=1 Tax=Anguilla anguilla TaxID=7936 RepID=A0A9D3S6K9_ANGAN|nr:hypothetical protein ANANG_G00010770 [Anguilla anguilla]